MRKNAHFDGETNFITMRYFRETCPHRHYLMFHF